MNIKQIHPPNLPPIDERHPIFRSPIALIGCGPASISCATFLARLGYSDLSIFERQNYIGGLRFAKIFSDMRKNRKIFLIKFGGNSTVSITVRCCRFWNSTYERFGGENIYWSKFWFGWIIFVFFETTRICFSFHRHWYFFQRFTADSLHSFTRSKFGLDRKEKKFKNFKISYLNS